MCFPCIYGGQASQTFQTGTFSGTGTMLACLAGDGVGVACATCVAIFGLGATPLNIGNWCLVCTAADLAIMGNGFMSNCCWTTCVNVAPSVDIGVATNSCF
jgi:hypothetical protein